MVSEYWKSSFTIDDTTYYLVKFKGEDKAVYRIGDSNLYRCYVYSEVIGMVIVRKHATWQQAEKFIR